jgi:hypothetical protein
MPLFMVRVGEPRWYYFISYKEALWPC